jgi:hypothetical protein
LKRLFRLSQKEVSFSRSFFLLSVFSASLVCAVDGPSRQQNKCEEPVSGDGPASAFRSWAGTQSPQPLEVSQLNAMNWRYEDWVALRGRTFSFAFDWISLGEITATSRDQAVLLPADFSFEKQKLIKKLIELESADKFLRKDSAGLYTSSLQEMEAALLAARQAGVENKGLSAEDLKSVAMEDVVSRPIRGVEVAAFLVTLKSGRVLTAVFTSSALALNPEHVQKALLQRISKEKNLAWQDVAAVQLFHTHPGPLASPLTKSDRDLADGVRLLFKNQGAVDIDSHVYAITHDPSGVLVFHYGLKAPSTPEKNRVN